MAVQQEVFRLLLGREEAASALSISVRKLDELAASNQLARVRIGRRVCFDPETLREFAEKNESRSLDR